MHMCISWHFLAGLADLHVTRQASETDREYLNKPCKIELKLQGEIVVIDPKP